MSNNIFQKIEILHSQWSLLDKFGKLGFLKSQWNSLNALANELALHSIHNRGLTPSEKNYAHQLLDMIGSVESQAAELNRDISNDIRKEITKAIIGH